MWAANGGPEPGMFQLCIKISLIVPPTKQQNENDENFGADLVLVSNSRVCFNASNFE